MKLQRLEVRRLPGIKSPFQLPEFGDGLNVITGPNGSGKTSLCRALRSLLWPSAEPLEVASFTSVFHTADGELEAEREGQVVTWRANGAPAEAPPLPPAHLARCFTIGVDDLLSPEGTDEDLARRLVRQMAGGYDLDQLVRDGVFRLGPLHGQRERRQLAEAGRELTRVRRGHAELREREESLERLEAERTEATRARDAARHIEAALELVRIRARRDAMAEELAGFPGGMERVREELAEELRRLAEDHERCREMRLAADRDEAAADEERRACRLPEGGLDEALLDERLQVVDSLRRLEARATELEREHREASVQAVEAQRTLAGALGPDADPFDFERAVSPETLARAEALLAAHEGLLRREQELDAKLTVLAGPDAGQAAPAGEDALRQAAGALRRWLSHFGAPSPSTRKRREAIRVGAALALLFTVAAGFAWPPMGWLAGLPAILSIVWILRPDSADTDDPTGSSRADFERAGLAPPKTWKREHVEARLRELEHELGDLLRRARAVTEREELEDRRRSLASERAHWDAARQALAAEVGLDPLAGAAGSAVGLVLLARNLGDLQAARRTVECMLAEASDLREKRRAIAEELVEFLRRHGEHAEPTALSLDHHLRSLVKRNGQLAAANAKLAAAVRSKLSTTDDTRRAKERLERAYREAGLEPRDDAGLAARLERLEEWRELSRRARENGYRMSALARELEEHGDLTQLGEAELELQLAATRALAEQVDALTEEVLGIRTAVDSARRSAVLADAMAVEREARDALVDRRNEALHAAAGKFIVQSAGTEHAREARPAVLRRAADLFANFTHHAFELELDAHGQAVGFAAVDTAAGDKKGLAELSAGTRMQLLLAVRLAFAMEVEKGEQLPFFLDEALTTSDPDRYQQVVESLRVLVEREGRQVFYLTSQNWEWVLWNVGGSGSSALKVVDLGKARRMARAASPVELAAPEDEVVPAALGRSAEEYAEVLGVPALNPHQTASVAHVYYLASHDLDLLRDLVSWKLDRVGPLERALESGAWRGYLDESQRDELRAWIEFLGVFLDAWRTGRGKPVTREDLELAGVTETFLDGMSELCRELDGDGERLLAALDVKGKERDSRLKRFSTKKRDELRVYLVEHDHLDPRPVLDETELRRRVRERMAPRLESGLLAREALEERLAALTHYAGASAAPSA